MVVGATVVVRGQVRAKTRNCTQQEDYIEVQILETLWICRDTVDEALQVWTLN